MNIFKKIDSFLIKNIDSNLDKIYVLNKEEKIQIKSLNRSFVNNLYIFIGGIFVGFLWKNIDFTLFATIISLSTATYLILSSNLIYKKLKLIEGTKKQISKEQNNSGIYILKNELLFTCENSNKEMNG